MTKEPILFELSDPGLYNDYLAPLDVPVAPLDFEARSQPDLPEVNEQAQ